MMGRAPRVALDNLLIFLDADRLGSLPVGSALLSGLRAWVEQ